MIKFIKDTLDKCKRFNAELKALDKTLNKESTLKDAFIDHAHFVMNCNGEQLINYMKERDIKIGEYSDNIITYEYYEQWKDNYHKQLNDKP